MDSPEVAILCSGIEILMIGRFALQAMFNVDQCLDISRINACLVLFEDSELLLWLAESL